MIVENEFLIPTIYNVWFKSSTQAQDFACVSHL